MTISIQKEVQWTVKRLPYECISLDVILKDCEALRSHSELHSFVTMILYQTNRHNISDWQVVITWIITVSNHIPHSCTFKLTIWKCGMLHKFHHWGTTKNTAGEARIKVRVLSNVILTVVRSALQTRKWQIMSISWLYHTILCSNRPSSPTTPCTNDQLRPTVQMKHDPYE